MRAGSFDGFKKPVPAAVSNRVFAALAIVLVVLVVFAPALRGGFVNWDDNKNITLNTAIRSFSPTNIARVFSSFFIGHYFPLTIFSYALEYRFFGLSPFPYHLDNVLLHCLNCLLVFWLFFLISRRTAVAFICAILFGIHPLQADSVAWVSERKNVLYAAFYLGALISYLNFLRKGSWKDYWITLALFVCSLLSKSMAVTLPVVLLLLHWREGGIIDRRQVFRVAPFFLLAAVFALAAVKGGAGVYMIRDEKVFDLPYKLMVAGYAVSFYVSKFFAPSGLAAFYNYIPPAVLPAGFFFALAAVLIVSLAAVFSLRRSRAAAFGWFFFLAACLPVLQFVPVGQMLVANHFVYVPLLGLIYIVAEAMVWFYARLGSRAARFAAVCALALAIAALGTASWKRGGVWKDGISLWSDCIAKYPRTATAFNNRGTAFLDRGDKDRARADFEQALRIDPDFCEAYCNLSTLAGMRGDLEEAVRLLKIAVSKDHVHFLSYDALVMVYGRMGRHQDALKVARAEVALRPDYAPGYLNLGSARAGLGDYSGAAEAFNKAASLDPNFAAAYFNLAVALFQAGQPGRAAGYYDKAQALGYEDSMLFGEQLKPYRSVR